MTAFFSQWTKVKLMFASNDKNDMKVANEILQQQDIVCSEKDSLIEELNESFPNWHFFMQNCMIRRVRSYKNIN